MKIGIIGGSGLSDKNLLANYQEVSMKTPYGQPASNLQVGFMDEIEVVAISRHGKNHTINPTKVPFRANIWALKQIGCTHILATTACGSLREQIKPGDLVFPDQFIDFTKHRILTFFDDKVIHTPMADPFDQQLRNELSQAAKKLNYNFYYQGTVITIEGPRFSTRAESKMFQVLGADIINMSTVPEVILAKELEIPYQAIAMVTDYDCWRAKEPSVTYEIVMQVMNENIEKVKLLLHKTIDNLNNH